MNSLKNKIISITVIIFSFGWFFAEAQAPVSKPGPNGIFVYFGKNIPLSFQYKLERKTTLENTRWEEIYRTSKPVLNYQEIVGKLIQAGSKSAAFTLPDSLTIERFIRLQRGKRTTDSVYLFNGQPCFIETMGTGFYDVSATARKLYEYRVSEIDGKEKPMLFRGKPIWINRGSKNTPPPRKVLF
jgi:hypothetical protein